MANTRRGDRLTAIHAAEDVQPRAERHREIVLRIHAEHPEGLTDFELAALMGVTQPSCGKRRLDLMRMGWIEDTGTTRPSPSGSAATVWAITSAGVREFEKTLDTRGKLGL